MLIIKEFEMQRRNTAYNRLRKTNNGTFRAYSDTSSRIIGLSYEQKGNRKAAILRVLLPFITRNGNTVPTDVRLTGAQARRLFEFLSAQYGTGNTNGTPTASATRKSATTTKRTRTTGTTTVVRTTKRKRNA